jgi:hypothetical protein
MGEIAPMPKRCLNNNCCHFIGDTPVTEAQFNEAVDRSPGNYPAIRAGGRNAVLYTFVACRKT